MEQPKKIELEAPIPVSIERPIKYIEKINIPVDGKGSESSLNNSVNTESTDGLQDLTDGYRVNNNHA